MVTEQVIFPLQYYRQSGGHRLLAHAKMQGAPHLVGRVVLFDHGLLVAAQTHHKAMQGLDEFRIYTLNRQVAVPSLLQNCFVIEFRHYSILHSPDLPPRV